MSKRVKMIAPFDVITGNVSGKQELKYAKNDNPAFEAPDGLQYARNYKPRYIVAQRNSDGLAYFGVRRRSAVNNTPQSRLQQAALGGAAALATVIMENPTWASQMDLLLASFLNGVKAGKIKEKSVRAWMTSCILPFLKDQREAYSFPLYLEDGTTSGTVAFYSPWGDPQFDTERNPDVSQDILVKFWLYLTPNGRIFVIRRADGRAYEGIFSVGQIWNEIITTPRLNVLGLTTKEYGEEPEVETAVSLDDLAIGFVVGAAEPTMVTPDLEIHDGGKYVLYDPA